MVYWHFGLILEQMIVEIIEKLIADKQPNVSYTLWIPENYHTVLCIEMMRNVKRYKGIKVKVADCKNIIFSADRNMNYK